MRTCRADTAEVRGEVVEGALRSFDHPRDVVVMAGVVIDLDRDVVPRVLRDRVASGEEAAEGHQSCRWPIVEVPPPVLVHSRSR